MSARILIAVTHLLGVGHLVRARHLASALAQAGHQVTLASGGMPDGRSADGYRFAQLPPVRTQGTDFRSLLDADGLRVPPEHLRARRAALAALAHDLSPDIVVTEHFPLGRRQLAEEFLSLIAAAKAVNPGALVLSSIRDVLVAPQRPERLEEAAARIASLFDAVLVHGDPRILPLDASWPVTPEIAGKLIYTGYLAPEARRAVPQDAPEGSGHSFRIRRAAMSDEMVAQDEGSVGHRPGSRDHRARDASGVVLVSGGGSAAALPLFETALAAASLLPRQAFHLLIGDGVAEAEFIRLRQSAPGNAVVERARPDFPQLLAACALSISLAGYNTVLDLLQARRRALLVPFDAGNETEQAVRAAALDRAGVARLARLDAGPSSLAVEIAAGLAAPPPATDWHVDLDGAGGSVAAIAALLARRG